MTLEQRHSSIRRGAEEGGRLLSTAFTQRDDSMLSFQNNSFFSKVTVASKKPGERHLQIR